MVRRTKLLFVFGLLLLYSSISGCGGDSRYGTVRGVVTLDGKPVSDATVAFVPKDEKVGRLAFGVTDTNGVYELSTTQAGDGALSGGYHVTITALDVVESEKARRLAEEFGSLAADMPQPKPKKSWRVPQSYSEKETSGLEFTVVSGSNSADWSLEK